jgi:uncharacterized membrane protein YedE/YeeE
MSRLVSLLAGMVFGLGLGISGMTDPNKVLGFLDVTGAWDPSLMLVLGGAVGVTALSFRLVLRSTAPLLGGAFRLPDRRQVDLSLLAGAALFGAGWGLSGYCPGPGIALLANLSWETWVFIPSLLAGMLLHRVPGGVRDRASPALSARSGQ